MPSRRAAIAMTPSEVEHFLETSKKLHLATAGRDGYPHLVPMHFAVIEGKIHLLTYGRSQKVLNLRRHPKMTVMLEDGDSYFQLRGVAIQGEAEIIENDMDLANQVAAGIHLKEHPEDAPARDESVMQQRRTKRVVVRSDL